jgi:hypothetical protein
MVDKGEVEEALKLHYEELRVYEDLGDISSKSVTLLDIARIELQRESYALGLKTRRLDVICCVGIDLGILLCQAGQKEEGLEILNRSKEGFKKLGQEELALRIEKFIRGFEG